MARADRWLNLLLVALLLLGSLPNRLHSALVAPEIAPSAAPPARIAATGSDESVSAPATTPRADLPQRIFLPFVGRDISPLDTQTQLLLPGVGGTISLLKGRIATNFAPAALQQATRVTLTARTAPSISSPGLAVAGPALSLSLSAAATGESIDRMPSLVRFFPGSTLFPTPEVVTPSITIAVQYTEADIWGLDERSMALYTQDGPGGSWRRVPSAVYPQQRQIVAHVEQGGIYLPMGRLAFMQAAAASSLRVALDPDDNVGWAIQNGTRVEELGYNVRLARAVRDRLKNDGCVVDEPLLTREVASPDKLDRTFRANSMAGWGADIAVTLAFNALYGSPPWGVLGDGGPLAFARSGRGDDAELARGLLGEIDGYTGRRSTQPVLYRGNGVLPLLPFAEFDGLSATYTHLETLYLDHRFDWAVINDRFDSVVDGVYVALRLELERRGGDCTVAPPGEDPRRPPLPPRPSAEQLQRWRDLGYQSYQRYGGDPVSFSTGNHILQLALGRIPGRGGLDIDLNLTYNAQDQRGDLLGFGWTFPYNIRLQRYADESVGVIFADGRTFHYERNGNDFSPPAGVFDRLTRDAEYWTLTSRDNEQTWRFQETVTGLGVLVEWRDRRGNTLRFTHDLNGQDAWRTGATVPRPPLTGIIDATNRTITVVPDDKGRIGAFILPDLRRFNFGYDERGDLVSITDANTPVRGVHSYTYDERHRIVEQRDPEGILFLTNRYDDRDRIVEQRDASLVPSFFQYDPLARTTVFTDNLSLRHAYAYDALNRVKAETDPLSRTLQTEYDPSYNITRTEDARGNETRFRYDGRGNLIERRDPLPGFAAACRAVGYTEDVTNWTYHSDNLVESMTDALSNSWSYKYDSEGNLIQVVAPIGETGATYDAWGQLETFTDANRHITTYRYDSHGNLRETEDARTGISRSTYDITGRELSYTDANSHTVFFEYSGNDQIVRLIDPKGRATTFRYDRNDLLLSTTDRVGTTREFRYDDNLKLIAERDHPTGAWQTYAYDKLYRRVATTDRLGYVTGFDYDSVGQLVKLREPNGASTQYAYDGDGNLTQVTDALGGVTAMAYDALGRLAASTDAAGSAVEYCYDAEDRLMRTVGPRADEIYSYSYDALGRLVSVTDPQGSVRRFEHDPVGNRITELTPLGDRTDFSYDELDRLAAVERPLLPDGSRPTTRFGYDKVGNTSVITSPRGFATLLAYDENDNHKLLSDPLGAQTKYTYDAEDRPLSVTDANGNTTTTQYDPVGNPIEIVNALGETTRLAYDPAYNLVRMVDPLGRPTTYDYDERSRLLRVTDPLANATTYRRDALGRVTGVLDAEGKPTSYSYDPVGRLLAVTDALNSATRYEYDEAGNLAGIADANNRTTRFAYNVLNQLTGEINPLGESWRYAYDPNGRLNRRVDALGRETFYEYDSNDRLAGVQYGAPVSEQPPLRFAYDLDGNETQMCDGLGCFAHSYDALGRLAATTDWLGRSVRRSYDGVGSLVELIYPNARPVRYEHDGANRLVGVTDPRGGTSVYERDANGQVTRLRHPNSTLTSYSYDAASRLTSIDHRQDGATTPQSAYAYTLDRVGNRTGVNETRAAFDGSDQLVNIERGYGYDRLDRLTRAKDSVGGDTAYRFDAVGNRLERSGTALVPDASLPELPVSPAPVAERSTYNAANQLTRSGEATLSFDRNGNRQDATRTLPDGRIEVLDYSYDREDRLVGVERRIDGAVVMRAVYEYDGYGRRARKTVTYPGAPARNQRITYLYDGLEIIGATVEEGGTTRELAFYLAPSPLTGLRRPYAMEDLGSGERYWFQADGLDSVVALTNEDGEFVAPMLYDEYGRHLAGDSTLQLFTFTAQDYDPETGLLHFHARYYDPATGTWLTQDPYRGRIDMPVTLHQYGYVNGNPLRDVDIYGYYVEVSLEGYYNLQPENFRTWAGHAWIRIKGCNSAEDNMDLCKMISNGNWKKWEHKTHEAIYDSNPGDNVKRTTKNLYTPDLPSATRRLSNNQQADLARFLKHAVGNWNYFSDGVCTRFAMQAWKAAGGNTLGYETLNKVDIITSNVPVVGISTVVVEQEVRSQVNNAKSWLDDHRNDTNQWINDRSNDATQWINDRRRDVENIQRDVERIGQAINWVNDRQRDWQHLQRRWRGVPWMR